jgi:hypothetical protein
MRTDTVFADYEEPSTPEDVGEAADECETYGETHGVDEREPDDAVSGT